MLKTKKFRRLLAGLLAVLMLSVCLPVGAFAAGGVRPNIDFIDAETHEVVRRVEVMDGVMLVGETYTIDNIIGRYVKMPENYEFAGSDDWKFTPKNENDNEIDIPVRLKETEPATEKVILNYYDEVNNKQVVEVEVNVPAGSTTVSAGVIAEHMPEGYEFKSAIGDNVEIMDGSVYVGVKPVEKPATEKVILNYYDEVNNKQVVEVEVNVPAGSTTVSAGVIAEHMPEGYEFKSAIGDNVEIMDGSVYVGVKPVEKPTSQTVGINYWDIINNKQAGESQIVVDANASNVNTSALKDIPEGYELSRTGDVAINDGWIFVEVRPVATTKTVGVNYFDIVNDVQVFESSVVVDADANNVNYTALTDIPEGYELVNVGDFQINDGWIFVAVRPVETTVTVGVNYWDIVNNKQVYEGKVTVDKDAYNVNTSDLTDIPDGYELVNVGDVQINDGWIFVEIKPIETTVTVGVNYWDVVNNKQVYEGKVTVDKDAYNVNTSDLTDIPEGYELVNVGDVQINDGWIFVEVRPVATTKVIGVNYWDVVNNEQVAEGEAIVAADAWNVNSSALVDIPEGYELVNVGDFQINDGWIYVEVKPVPTTKTVGLNYWDIINNKQVAEGSVEVAADATNVNTSTFTDIPEGYELVWTGDLQINDGWVWVEVRPATRTVGLNYWDIVNNEQVSEGSVEVDIDATNVNTSTFTDIPEGYELVWTGDLQINDGWVWVEVRPTKTLRIFWAIDNGEQADFADGSEDMYTQELTWKHINDDITMPELAIADGYKLAGWSVSGQESEYWDASLETTNVGGRYVEDENGGIISITANIVAVTEEPTKPSDPSTGDNTTTVTGKDEHPDIAEAKANGTWGAPTATPVAASTIPQTGDSMPVVMLIVIALAAAGAVGGLVVLRKRSHQ